MESIKITGRNKEELLKHMFGNKPFPFNPVFLDDACVHDCLHLNVHTCLLVYTKRFLKNYNSSVFSPSVLYPGDNIEKQFKVLYLLSCRLFCAGVFN